MRYILLFMLLMHQLNAANLSVVKWKNGQTFSEYLEDVNISSKIFSNIDKDDLKFLSDITSQDNYYELRDEKNKLLEVFIPINEVMQIHLARGKKGNEYDFDILPIEFDTNEYFAKIKIENNPYVDTLNTLHNANVAKRLSVALKNIKSTKKMQKGDEIDFIYTQKIRNGKPYLMPKIKVIRIKRSKDEVFIYVDEEGRGFTKTGKSVAYTVNDKKKVVHHKKIPVKGKSSTFGMPLRHVRITSRFTYKRWHPIFKRYRPHHGTDFGAKKGTPLLAVQSGKVSFSGWMGGYGKVVKIKHPGGYESLYAHQSKRRVKKGQSVKKGQIIGYVGSTGRSTGPHLHFGLQKNGRWVNPMHVLNKKSVAKTITKTFTTYKNVKTTKYKTVEIKGVKEKKKKLLAYIKNNKSSHVWDENDQ